MGKGFARDNYAEAVAHGEIRERQTSRRVGLGEVDFLVVAVFGTPGTHAALEGAEDAVTETIAVSPLQFFKQGPSLQTRFGFQQRNQFRVPDAGQWVCAGSPVAQPPL